MKPNPKPDPTKDTSAIIGERIAEARAAGRAKYEPGEVVNWIQLQDHPIACQVVTQYPNGSVRVMFPEPMRWFGGAVEVTLDPAALRKRRQAKA